MCGMDNFDYQNSNEELRRPEKAPTKPKKTQSSDDDLIKPVKEQTKSNNIMTLINNIIKKNHIFSIDIKFYIYFVISSCPISAYPI
jgi:CHAT domain-containing protein